MAELRVPPGRAGRLWLTRRLATARRAATLLDRKLQILRSEQERFALLAGRTDRSWRTAQEAADRWMLCAAMLGGQREIRLSTSPALADVSVSWGTVMGIRYPVEAVCRPPPRLPGERGPGTAALVEASAAHRVALEAAVAHAAATTTKRIVDAEVVETRRRLHAIADRWIPRLEAALHRLSERLEESERAETLRLRWARGAEGAGGG